MDVVEDAVGVEDLVGLTDHDPHHVRLVLTALLIDDHRSLGSGPGLPGREPLRDPDHDVPHRVAAAEDQHLVRHGSPVLLGAHRVGVHGDRLEGGDFPVEGDGSGDRRCGESDVRARTRPRPARPPGTTSSPSCASSSPSSSSTRLLGHRRRCRRPVIRSGSRRRNSISSKLYTRPVTSGNPRAMVAACDLDAGLWSDLTRSRTRAIRRASGRAAERAPAVASASPPPPRSTRRRSRTRRRPEPTDGAPRDGASA